MDDHARFVVYGLAILFSLAGVLLTVLGKAWTRDLALDVARDEIKSYLQNPDFRGKLDELIKQELVGYRAQVGRDIERLRDRSDATAASIEVLRQAVSPIADHAPKPRSIPPVATVIINGFWRGSCGTAPQTYALRVRASSGGKNTSADTGQLLFEQDFSNDANTTPGSKPFGLSTDPLVVAGDLEIVIACIQVGPQGELSREASVTVSADAVTAATTRATETARKNGQNEWTTTISAGQAMDLSAPRHYCQAYCDVVVRLDGCITD